jgi:hypothetical protein
MDFVSRQACTPPCHKTHLLRFVINCQGQRQGHAVGLPGIVRTSIMDDGRPGRSAHRTVPELQGLRWPLSLRTERVAHAPLGKRLGSRQDNVGGGLERCMVRRPREDGPCSGSVATPPTQPRLCLLKACVRARELRTSSAASTLCVVPTGSNAHGA